MNLSKDGKSRTLLMVGACTLMVLQGCAFAPDKPSESSQRTALSRWHQCLERFDENLTHYCDGHRRDVIATYPHHLENQVSEFLSEQLRVTSASRLVKTGLRNVADSTAEQLGNYQHTIR